MITAFKFAEMMVDLRQLAGYPAVSRAGLYEQRPQQEFRELRQHPSTHVPPEHFYTQSAKPLRKS